MASSLIQVLVACRDPGVVRRLSELGKAVGLELHRIEPGDLGALGAGGLGAVDVVVVESDRVGDAGWTLMERVRERTPMVESVILCSAPTVDSAVAAVRSGVHSVLPRPVTRERLIQAIVGAWVRKRHGEERLRVIQGGRGTRG